MSEDKHSPLPWSVGAVTAQDNRIRIFEIGDAHILPPEGNVGPIALAAGKTNAEFIVRAVNHHDELVSALEKLCDAISRQGEDSDEFCFSYNAARGLISKVRS
jgi:hypothetical protein